MRNWEFKEWLIVIAFVLAGVALLYAVIKTAEAKPVAMPAGCQQTKFPAVCTDSYKRCDDIGLNEACLAVARLDGQLGYSSAQGNDKKPMSQNKTTEVTEHESSTN